MKVQPSTNKRITVPVALVLTGLALLASLALLWTPAQAQDGSTPTAPQASSITFSGGVESVGPRFIVVNGLMVDLQGAEGPLGSLQLGAPVTIVGTLQNGVVQATLVQLDDDDDTSGANQPGAQPATSTPVPSSGASSSANRSDDGARRIIIQGPVRQVSPTSIRIFDLTITIDPNTVIVTNISVGDNVRVVGSFTTVNNTFQIQAVNITPITPVIFRGSDDISDRDSRISDRISDTISDRQSDRTSDSFSDRQSDRDSDRQPAPPPPPPPPRSDRDSISAASSRSSRSS